MLQRNRRRLHGFVGFGHAASPLEHQWRTFSFNLVMDTDALIVRIWHTHSSHNISLLTTFTFPTIRWASQNPTSRLHPHGVSRPVNSMALESRSSGYNSILNTRHQIKPDLAPMLGTLSWLPSPPRNPGAIPKEPAFCHRALFFLLRESGAALP